MRTTPDVRPFFDLLSLRARMGGRWLRAEGFTIFVMAPLVVRGAALIFEPFIADAARGVRVGSLTWISEHTPALIAVATVALVVARLSGTIRDAFAIREADFALDSLPIAPLALAHDVLLRRVAKALPVTAAVMICVALAAPEGVGRVASALGVAVPALVYGAALGVVETGAAMLLVHARLVRPVRLAIVALAAGAVAVALDAVLVFLTPIVVAAMYGATLLAFSRWRVADRDAARYALARARRSNTTMERLADRSFGPRIGAQVVRDLRLVRRGFSSAVYASVGLAAVVPGATAWLVERFALSPSGRYRAAGAATVGAAFALAALTHALVAYERPRVWIDLVSGVSRQEFPRARTWTARLLAAPAFLAGLLVAIASGVPVGFSTVATLAWVTWATASLTGVLCYELKERPAAGLVLSAVLAGGVSLLFVVNEPFELMWYFGLFAYVYAMFHLEARAGDKVVWVE